MANKRQLVKRRKSVRNIRKITRTMQLIATARFQAALNRATATKPYTEKLQELVSALSGAADNVDHALMHANEDAKTSAMVIITSKRGLCGGYNGNVLRAAIGHLDAAAAEDMTTDVHMVGRKGASFFKFLRRPVAHYHADLSDPPGFDDVEPIANAMMDRFIRGEIAAVYVTYMKFLSAGKQTAVVEQLLPLTHDVESDGESGGAATKADFEFSPEPKALLDELLPASVRIKMFQCFTDATVSEQIARMVAMKAATDAAGDMITSLSRQYNRARQTQITLELLDIIGGVNALS